MQTFLPYPDYLKSAQVLDKKRLGKQRVEAKQLLNIALGKTTGWSHHPAAKMWVGYAGQLAVYGAAMCLEFRGRGCNDSLLDFFLEYADIHSERPAWLGDEAFHSSHRSALMLKGFHDMLAYRMPYTRPKIDRVLKDWGLPILRECELEHLVIATQRCDAAGWPYSPFPNHYLQFGWTDKITRNYVWPRSKICY
jgi:hypothetical protein